MGERFMDVRIRMSQQLRMVASACFSPEKRESTHKKCGLKLNSNPSNVDFTNKSWQLENNSHVCPTLDGDLTHPQRLTWMQFTYCGFGFTIVVWLIFH